MAGVHVANTGVGALGTSLVIQPTGGEFGITPCTITLRVHTMVPQRSVVSCSTVTGVFRNNADRPVSVGFSYSGQAAATQPTVSPVQVADLSFSTPSPQVPFSPFRH